MRISDWSSDVCSSDLHIMGRRAAAGPHPYVRQAEADQFAEHLADFGRGGEVARRAHRVAGAVIMLVRLRHIMGDGDGAARLDLAAIGRASCRERVCQYV